MVHGSAFWKMIQCHCMSLQLSFFISKLLKLNSEYSKKALTILLDNASIHKSSLIFKVITFLKIKLLFFSPCSPELAAVEHLFKEKINNKKVHKAKADRFFKRRRSKSNHGSIELNQQEVHSKLLDFDNYYCKRSY